MEEGNSNRVTFFSHDPVDVGHPRMLTVDSAVVSVLALRQQGQGIGSTLDNAGMLRPPHNAVCVLTSDQPKEFRPKTKGKNFRGTISAESRN